MSSNDGSGAMFSEIAAKYDRLNRISSFGCDRHWRSAAVDELVIPEGGSVLDLAAGTADLALTIARRHSNCQVVACDPSIGMLRIAVEKIAAASMQDRITVALGCGECLPFGDSVFDIVVIGFGIRNFVSREEALRDIHRVLKPGGQLVILELSMPKGTLMSPLARFYIRHVIPTLGRILSSGTEYVYLSQSMSSFPGPEGFVPELQRAGFIPLRAAPYLFSSCHLYVAEVGDDTR